MAKVITTVIMIILTLVCGIYSVFAFHCKGPILTNNYIWLSESERKNIDEKKEYRQASTVFGILSLVFASDAVYFLTRTKTFLVIAITALVIDMIYGIISHRKSSK